MGGEESVEEGFGRRGGGGGGGGRTGTEGGEVRVYLVVCFGGVYVGC